MKIEPIENPSMFLLRIIPRSDADKKIVKIILSLSKETTATCIPINGGGVSLAFKRQKKEPDARKKKAS